MKKMIFVLAVLIAMKGNAQTYLISFSGTGASTSVSAVKAENLTKGTFLNLNGNDILRLTSTTGVYSFKDNQSTEMKIYPNPMTDNSKFEFVPPVAGDAVIGLLDMTGKPVVQIQSYFENSKQVFRLSGVKKGFFLINIKGNGYQLSGKLFSNGNSNSAIKIEKVNSVIQALEEKGLTTDNKGSQATVDMTYSTGDRLKFTGISGNYSTIIIDIPETDKTIDFNFVACADGDNNNYPVVGIGTQIWMAENLKTTKFSDNTSISLVTANSVWETLTTPAYCWFNNNEAAYKDVCGALYNWFSVNEAGNGGKKICPTGWHVPTDLQWSTLIDYLTNNGYGVDGSGNDIAKSMASSSGWTPSLISGTPGLDLADNNSSGFTALPNGLREWGGSFNTLGNYGFLWSSTESIPDFAWGRQMYSDVSTVDRNNIFKFYGAAVRCLSDN